MSVEELGHKYSEYLDKYSVSENTDTINVHLVVVKPELRGEGVGRRLFTDINKYADHTGKVITLSPSSEFGGSKSKLRKFYKSLGFTDNKGRKKRYEYMSTMYRLPRNQENLNRLIQTALLEAWKDFF